MMLLFWICAVIYYSIATIYGLGIWALAFGEFALVFLMCLVSWFMEDKKNVLWFAAGLSVVIYVIKHLYERGVAGL